GGGWCDDSCIRLGGPEDWGWMGIVSVTGDGGRAAVGWDGTVARVDLPRALEPRGTVTLDLRFTVQVPKVFYRFGRVGDSYSMGQWYPKVAVYDDLGWHADPFHYFSEFFENKGHFEVSHTLHDRIV